MTIYSTSKEVNELYKDYEEKAEVAKNAKGNAECVLLAQALTDAPQSTKWKRGDKVRGGSITAGTAIAIFKDDGTYDGNSGVCHAAIYLGQSVIGVKVWDQWRNGHRGDRKANGYFHGIRTCRFVTDQDKKSNGYRHQNDGDAFHVITSDPT